MRAAILCLFLLGAFVGASSSTAGNADAAAGDVPADVPELKDSYTSIFVPCRLTFYGDGSGAGGREGGGGGGPERLLAHSNYGSPFCGEELQVLSVDDRHIMFWPDALVGDAIVCYGASAAPKLEEEALQDWRQFRSSLEFELAKDSPQSPPSFLPNLDGTGIAGNVTERILSEFSVLSGVEGATHFTVDCTRDKLMAKEAADVAEMVFVGAAVTFSVLVLCCAGIVLSMWWCCCRSEGGGEAGGDWREVSYTPEHASQSSPLGAKGAEWVPAEYVSPDSSDYGSIEKSMTA
jgi:hypothetical protein